MSSARKEAKSKKRKSLGTDDEQIRKVKKSRKHVEKATESTSGPGFLGLAATTVDPALSSLFAGTNVIKINKSLLSKAHSKKAKAAPEVLPGQTSDDGAASTETRLNGTRSIDTIPSDEEEVDDESLSSLDDAPSDLDQVSLPSSNEEVEPELPPQKRQRKKKDDFDDLEANYLTKISKESDKVDAENKAAKRAPLPNDSEHASAEENDPSDAESEAISEVSMSPVPQHESLTAQESEFEKAQRTVFLGNVSLDAVTTKSARTTLKSHLTSFFASLPSSSEARSLTSIRFRSTPFSTSIPKRAAFAKKEIMDATAHSTNAYAVYSSPALARAATHHLNGTTVLSRHLRVDSVAHPSPVDHKRCVFIGNLGFVDDDSNVDAANAETGREKRKGNKTPSDVEEGLWRTFSKVGAVESVRVIRDSKTRVGKGIAYVQFKEEMSVEEALLWDGKKDPPMLPRKLRVSRAKVQKRNVGRQREKGREEAEMKNRKGGYVRKLTDRERSQMGRAERLLGKRRAGDVTGANGVKVGVRGGASRGPREGAGPLGGGSGGIKAPENFVFEGQRATRTTDAGVKMKKGTGKKAKPTKNSGKRAAAWKAKKPQA
ncbi:Nucleolar protein 12 [Sphaceloma murrayae]|uniref:Nucleolar protein 12 n=1 Tax=Sphaceloma murrayae TaxID=2082308 RepID=A0A2K1QSX2_9PEZI|nr:Nucleolar protein 12 [Sphaceloma murrayae]